MPDKSMPDDLMQPGWRLPRSLMERIDRAYHWKKAQETLTLTKSEFVADLLASALAQPKTPEKRSSAASGGQ
jgi:hypothetical protein